MERAAGTARRPADEPKPCRIGIASWNNPPSERERRPKERSHLAQYAGCFNCVEINSSFYRPHRRETYQRWRDSTPAGFAFSVKMPRAVTHECGLRGCTRELLSFIDQVTGLGDKLGVLLVQLPPSLEFDARIVRAFFDELKGGSSADIACEPRHATWFTSEVESLFERLGIARVAADPSRGPRGDEPGGSLDLAYYRLHGTPQVYYSAYETDFLRRIAAELRIATSRSGTVWCVFDNTARHESWRNACELGALMEQGSDEQ